MEEIQIGEYVRTNDGYIGKIIDETKDGGYYMEKFTHIILRYNRDFLKHSKNIIDLIEYGDLVKFKGWGTTNGIDCIDMRTNENINLVFSDAEFCNGWNYVSGEKEYMIYDLDYLISKDQSNKIDWVLTHEQIGSNCYKIER